MEQVPNQDNMQYVPSRSELLSPQTDWQLSWRLCRLKSLNSEMISFNFKLLHQLLPVRHRLHQLTPATSPLCSLCTNTQHETIEHALLSCPSNNGTGQDLISILQRVVPAVTPEQLLLLQFPDLNESQELSIVFLTAAWLLEVWDRRSKKMRINGFEIRTTLEARCSLLRETRFHNNFEIMQELILNL